MIRKLYDHGTHAHWGGAFGLAVSSLLVSTLLIGCATETKPHREVPKILDGLSLTHQIAESDMEQLQNHFNELRESKSNLNASQFIDLLGKTESVQAMSTEQQEDLSRALAYLLSRDKHLLGEVRGISGAISEPFVEFFILDGVTGHYYLDDICTPVLGPPPPTYISEWFAFSCEPTNGTMCPVGTVPSTYQLYWCDE